MHQFHGMLVVGWIMKLLSECAIIGLVFIPLQSTEDQILMSSVLLWGRSDIWGKGSIRLNIRLQMV